MTTAVATRSRKRQPKVPDVDPVTRYARAVLAGTPLAGRAVRLACERHLRDLGRAGTPAFPFTFDATAAQHIIDFYAEFLTLENGDPFVLLPWQQFILGSVFGWKRPEGQRRFQTAYVETGKGSGKTPMLAGVGLYGLGFDDEPNAEIYSAAFDQDQASITLRDAIRMAKASDDLAEILDIGKYNIAHIESGSFFRAMSSEHRSKSGQRPHMGLIDELHEHRDGVIVNKVRAGFKYRPQPVLFEITNSGHDRTSICWQHHQHSLAVLEQTIADEQWFAYVCQLDPCPDCFGAGYRQAKEGCAACDTWTDPAVWVKANPSLGITIKPEYLQTQIDLALAMPSDQALVKRLNFCIWTESHQVWITSDQWDACRAPAVHADNPDHLACAAGLDPASIHDLAAFVVALRIPDPPSETPAETVTIDSMDEAGARVALQYRLDYSVELVPFFWIPEETLHERVRTERVPMDVWARDGHLRTTAGAVIDHLAIYDFVVLDALKRFHIQRVGMDQNAGELLFVKLRDEGRLGDKIRSHGQGKRLSEAFKFMEVLIRSRRLRHDGQPVLAWNVANAEPQRDRMGALWLEKASATKRIDGAVAAAMAIKELMVLPSKRRSVGVMVV